MNKKDFSFTYYEETNVLKIVGDPNEVKVTIIDMISEGKIPDTLNAIWFSGDPITLITGDALVLYLLPEVKEPPPPSFMEIMKEYQAVS